MAAEVAYKKEDMQLLGDAQRFANLTIFRGVAESDENGNAVVDVKLPNFFGTMRLFVVAVSDESYGSAEKSISVKAPVIVETSAPRVLKVGDKFAVPVTLFPIEKAIGNSEITLTYNGKTYNKKVNVKDGKSEKVLFELRQLYTGLELSAQGQITRQLGWQTAWQWLNPRFADINAAYNGKLPENASKKTARRTGWR